MNVEGLSAANYNCLLELMDYYKVDILKNAKVLKYEDGKAYIEITTYNEPNIRGRAFNQSLQGIHRDVKAVEADTVIVSVGYASNQDLYNAIQADNVHLLGDANRPSNLMGCIWSAYTACLHI
ncbi:MAG: 2,4-dienoyl-CoA reductase [Oscillospiraceae bacterium]|nr:2,4-dienoyl-CoA reductase [Oscillospiraceae bacterium]